jgi:hypothetical protein
MTQGAHSSNKGRDVATALTTPHAAAVAGILFAVSLAASLYLIQLSISEDEFNSGSWLTSNRDRATVGVPLIPLAGVCFLWFMGVLRHRFGEREDQFYSTVFIGSGLLFVAMMFTGTAVIGAILAADKQDPEFAGSGGYSVTARIAVMILGTYGLKMGGVFLFSLGTMFLRTGVVPRWVAFTQFAVGIVLLFGVTRDERAVLIFPFWILVLSVVLLVLAYRDPAVMASPSKSAAEDRPRRSA